MEDNDFNESSQNKLSHTDEEPIFDLNKLDDIIKLIENNNESFIKSVCLQHINTIINKYKLSDKYNIIFLYDDNRSISNVHSDNIYRSLRYVEEKKDVLLILHSRGGSIEPAYLISKTCKRLKDKKFVVAVPRRAKSAATLISLGADEIHMGLMSELGPIDPQIDKLPAVAISNALRKIAQLSSEYPKSSDMFSKFLTENLSLSILGYFERVNESASQYAARLIGSKKLPQGQTAEKLGEHFTNHYKDHSFVIDIDECLDLLGTDIIKTDSEEYKLSDEIYRFMDLFELVCKYILNKGVSIVGNGDYCFSLDVIK